MADAEKAHTVLTGMFFLKLRTLDAQTQGTEKHQASAG
jgi:hypothetical protein